MGGRGHYTLDLAVDTVADVMNHTSGSLGLSVLRRVFERVLERPDCVKIVSDG